MELNQRLEAAPDDKAREQLITQLAAALSGPPAAAAKPAPALTVENG